MTFNKGGEERPGSSEEPGDGDGTFDSFSVSFFKKEHNIALLAFTSPLQPDYHPIVSGEKADDGQYFEEFSATDLLGGAAGDGGEAKAFTIADHEGATTCESSSRL